MTQRGAPPTPQDGTADILYLVDQLEELVGIGKRVPFSGRVMVEEEEFLALIDQLRVAVPNEIKQAQRVIKDRERIIGDVQDEAARIVQAARDRAEAMVSQHGIVAEARQRSEELLRAAEEERQRARGEIDVFVMEQLQLVEDAVRRGMAVMEDAVEQTIDTIGGARDAIGT
ncbi:MAG: ATPase [Chloroflexia bacterium]|jgi:transcription initiation factor TFIIIB Brf1 subunit/transcription initiation factor TFIIB|nr:ATPase [Chloroflexia bacterium]